MLFQLKLQLILNVLATPQNSQMGCAAFSHRVVVYIVFDMPIIYTRMKLYSIERIYYSTQHIQIIDIDCNVILWMCPIYIFT